jgi:hypothetical protein
MPDHLIVFENVELMQRDDIGFQCRIASKVVHVGSLQWRPGTTLHVGGDRLVLDRLDATELGLLDDL